MVIDFFQMLMKPLFGTFEREEFKKFLRMGAIFSFIIGSYWTLRPLKNAIFCTLVGSAQIPWAKTISLIFLVPLLVIYTKLLDTYKREKVFYIISAIYGCIALTFALLLARVQTVSCVANAGEWSWAYIVSALIGYTFYLFVESYGSLLPALFWAIASDTTPPDSAKKGYSFVVALGQFGGIIGPYFIASLPRRLGLTTSALSIFICAITIIISILLLKIFFKRTPKELLVSYHGQNELKEEKEQEPGFFEGLWLLLNHYYLLGIFAVVAFPEIIMTIIDLHFNSLAAQTYTGTHLAEYLGAYATSVNFIALLFLICGIGNITRILGVGISLLLMPIIYGVAIFGFNLLNSLSFLFVLMASSKAINYALNGPAIKQLYIPTTHDVRFKSQAWIETFGSRGAKEGGSIFNMLLAPLQKNLGEIAGRARHAFLSSILGYAMVIIWFFIAWFLGKKYKHAIDEKKVVC